MMTDMGHMAHLAAVAAEDVQEIERKEATYQGSWKKRGGVGAFMMMARKWDRLETMLASRHFDIFDAIEMSPLEVALPGSQKPLDMGADGTALAEVRDLRRYLLLVEAEMVARGMVVAQSRGTPTGDRLTTLSAKGVDIGHLIVGHPTIITSEGLMTPEERQDIQRKVRPRAEDGVPPNHLPGWNLICNYEAGHLPLFIIDRRKEPPEDWDHLPRLSLDITHKELEDTPAEYRPLYEQKGMKWCLRPEFVEHWGQQP